MRLFIALELSEEQRRELTEFQARFKNHFSGVRWIKPEGMHLTLKFIGEANQAGVESISDVVSNVVQSEQPFNLVYSGCGVFPAPGNARILWVGLSQGAEITSKIAETLDSSLSFLGFKKERQQFKPHLTIGRIRQPLESKLIYEFLNSGEDFNTSPGRVSSLTLFESNLTSHGAVYSVVCRKNFSRNIS
jgi:RNA 2',3'-cyclic 3'-phosphodiesterase